MPERIPLKILPRQFAGIAEEIVEETSKEIYNEHAEKNRTNFQQQVLNEIFTLITKQTTEELLYRM